MDSLYQLRKDIDELYSKFFNVDNGEWNISSKEELDAILERLDSDNSLEVLETNLNSFSESLDNFHISLNSFGGELEDYGGTLQDFKDAMDGTPTEKGFVQLLGELKVWMYGEGSTYIDPETGETKPCDYENPSSDSIKGMINNLDNLLHEIEAGDGIVLENLGRLKDHLQAFSGTLAEFKQYLRNQGVDVSTLDDAVLSLILEINNNLSVIEDHQELIEKAEETIGEPATATSEATGFYKKFDEGDAIMEGLDGRTEDVELILNGDDDNQGLIEKTDNMVDTIYDEDEGLLVQTNGIIDTIGEPAQGQQSATGMHLLIDNAQETANGVSGVADNIKYKMGYDDIETPLQTQITATNGTATTSYNNTHKLDDVIGGVYTTQLGTLQDQILGLYMFLGNIMGCKSVADNTERDALRSIKYPYCYVESTGKYYEYVGEDILGNADNNLG